MSIHGNDELGTISAVDLVNAVGGIGRVEQRAYNGAIIGGAPDPQGPCYATFRADAARMVAEGTCTASIAAPGGKTFMKMNDRDLAPAFGRKAAQDFLKQNP